MENGNGHLTVKTFMATMLTLSGLVLTISIFILSIIFNQITGTEAKASTNTTEIEVLKTQVLQVSKEQKSTLEKIDSYLLRQDEILKLMKEIKTRLIQ